MTLQFQYWNRQFCKLLSAKSEKDGKFPILCRMKEVIKTRPSFTNLWQGSCLCPGHQLRRRQLILTNQEESWVLTQSSALWMGLQWILPVETTEMGDGGPWTDEDTDWVSWWQTFSSDVVNFGRFIAAENFTLQLFTSIFTNLFIFSHTLTQHSIVPILENISLSLVPAYLHKYL